MRNKIKMLIVCKYCNSFYLKCDVCIQGFFISPLFKYNKEIEYLTSEEINLILKDKNIIEALLYVPIYMTGHQILNEKEQNKIQKYWNNQYRYQTVSETMLMVASYVNKKKNRLKKLT